MRREPNGTPLRPRRHRPAALLCLCLVASFVFAPTSHAHFERLVLSARNAALGGAFVSVADDPTAVVANPAGLTLMTRAGALATYHQPYNVTGLDGGFAAVGVPLEGAGALGASWHHVGMREALSENVITVAFARNLVATTQDASLSVGLSLDYMRVSADQTGASDQMVTGALGVLLRPFPSIGVGYAARNVLTGDIHLLEGGPGTGVNRQQAWGLSVKWNNRVTVSIQRGQTAAREWRNHAGVEVVAHPNLSLRGGVDGRFLTSGFGLWWRAVRVDVSVVSHDQLGATYLFTIGYLPKKRNPYAQR